MKISNAIGILSEGFKLFFLLGGLEKPAIKNAVGTVKKRELVYEETDLIGKFIKSEVAKMRLLRLYENRQSAKNCTSNKGTVARQKSKKRLNRRAGASCY